MKVSIEMPTGNLLLIVQSKPFTCDLAALWFENTKYHVTFFLTLTVITIFSLFFLWGVSLLFKCILELVIPWFSQRSDE